MTLQEILDQAVAHQQASRLDSAERLYRQVLLIDPAHVDALHLLGALSAQRGKLAEAVDLITRAVQLRPQAYELWHHLGLALYQLGKFHQSANALRNAAALRPDDPNTQYVLGNTLFKLGQTGPAIEAYRTAIKLNPNASESYNNLGIVLQSLGRIEEAADSYRQVTRVRPEIPEAHFNLGGALQSLRQFDGAISAYRRALELRPDYIEALNNLGNSLRSRGLAGDAQTDPATSEQNAGDFEDAAAAFERALSLDPKYPEAHVNLGNLLKDTGRLGEAIAAYRNSLALMPSPTTASNLLYALHFHPDYGPRELHEEHRKWNEQFIAPLARLRQPHPNDRTQGRRLRIGYVSPDFREHPIGRFMLPLLTNHDHLKFEIYCYSDVRRDTPATERFKSLADVWRATATLSDEQLARLIRDDHIDVLVDLTMHMEGSRMLMFGRKPAPVQVTYLAYCGTSGSEAIDYFFTDPYLAPSESERQFYIEKPIELRSYWCNVAPQTAPEVGPLPALASGQVTFGCLNNFSKASTPAIQAWATILRSVPRSRLILHSHKGPHRATLLEQFITLGIDSNRIGVIGYLSLTQYLQTFNQIDIALDPFPYPGGTTTFDAIWMGAPVVTLAGSTPVSRGGASILSHLELTRLIANGPAQYVQIATDLASNLQALAELRRALRQRLGNSVLTDGPGFARDIEVAYQQMWNASRESTTS